MCEVFSYKIFYCLICLDFGLITHTKLGTMHINLPWWGGANSRMYPFKGVWVLNIITITEREDTGWLGNMWEVTQLQCQYKQH